MYAGRIFFIHLPTDGHLACFYILAHVNNAAMNIGVHVYIFKLGLWISSDKYPDVGLLSHIVVLFFYF